MPRTFDGVDDRIRTSVSSEVNFTFGTFGAILKCSSFAAQSAWMRFISSGAANRGGVFFNTSGQVGFSNGASAPAGATSLVAGEWYCVLVTKTTGTTTPRVHIYRYSDNTWVHENTGGTAANATAPGTDGFLVHGGRGADQFFPGDIALDAIWLRALSDAECELLPFNLLNWYHLEPGGLWIFDQGNTANTLRDQMGTGANQTSIVGTTIPTTANPVFTYGGHPWTIIRPQSGGPTLYDRSVDGNMPASSATLSRQLLGLRSLAGSKPSDSGSLAKQLSAFRTIVGNKPSDSGTLAKQLAANRTVTGDKPADSGSLNRQLLALRSIVGSMPASSAVLSGIASINRDVAGNMAAASATLSRLLLANRSVVGSAPESTATLIRQILVSRSVAGNIPSQSGTLGRLLLAVRSVTGSNGTVSGALGRVYLGGRSLVGSLPSSSATLSRYYVGFRSLVGNLPSSTATLIGSSGIFRNLFGDMPTSTGTLSNTITATRNLLGSLPSSSGTLTKLASFSRDVVGNIPASSGLLRRYQNLGRDLFGVMPASSGVLARSQLFFRSLVGSLPSFSGLLEYIESVIIPITSRADGKVTLVVTDGVVTKYAHPNGIVTLDSASMSRFNLVAFRGDTIPLKVTITRDGSAVNLTGATFRLACKKWLSDSTALITVTDAEVTTPASGIAIITIPPEATADFTDNIDLNCDVQMTESSGRKTTVAYGILSLKADIA